MIQRAEHMDQTRQRIVEATVRLHEEIGLAATTVSAVAEAAGVTRLTVYRHFPEDADLFLACSAHWRATHPLPDPEAWKAETEPESRLRRGLADLYRHYGEGQRMIQHVLIDIAVLPEGLRRQLQIADRRYRTALLGAFPPAQRGRRRRAAVGHATSFWTWHSLCFVEGLPIGDAVELMTELVMASSQDRTPAAKR